MLSQARLARLGHALLPPALGLVLGLGLGEACAGAPTRSVAVSAALAAGAGEARLTLTLSDPVEARSFVLDQPDRVVVELPGVNCQLPPEAGRERGGLVAGFRCGAFAPGRSRLVVDLSGPARVVRLAFEPGASGLTHLLLDLARTDRASFRRAAAAPGPDPDTTGAIGRGGGPAEDGRPVVALDAGHGGADAGATAATGDLEKDVVLAFARSLRDRLEASGLVKVFMTRDADVFVPLDERVRLARAAGAELFVSIHGDSIGSGAVRGATIYTGAERATDPESARFAERENAADVAGGVMPTEVPAGVSDILAELTLRETRGLAHRLAGILQADLSAVMRFSPKPHRQAGFRVLRSADMTSVLVELGYLSNLQDAELLRSEEWRRRGTAAMAGAIERFFGPRLSGRAAVSP